MLSESLEILLQTKSFAQLNASERALALSEITAEEYAEFYLLLGKGKAVLQHVPAKDTDIEARLQNHLQHVWQQPETSPRADWWLSLFNYQMPVWQTTLGVLALLFYFNFNRPTELVMVHANPEKVYVYNTDTVFKEKNPDTVQVNYITSDTASERRFTPSQPSLVTTTSTNKKVPSSRMINIKPSQNVTALEEQIRWEQRAAAAATEMPPLSNDFSQYEGFARGRSAEEDSSIFKLIDGSRGISDL